jgi:methylenetetrahydrofolate dehydrogenase (NADP+)/methenyltetrahydrofolate cyclohydrolase
LGVEYRHVGFERTDQTAAIADRIALLNADADVQGIMLGLPVYKHLDGESLANAIISTKDIDGLGAINTFYLATNQEHRAIAPATAVAALHIAQEVTGLQGRRVAVLGRGRTVGRPVAAMLVNRDATVTVCHSRSRNIAEIVAESEIVVSAVGSPHFVEAAWLREGQVVVDCGISFVDGRTTGDVDSEAASRRGAIVSPVPGGVGAVTNIIIFANLLRAIRLQNGNADAAS